MPWHPSTASFLNDRQKEIARLRLLKDGSSSTKTKFDRKAFFKPLKDPKFYAYGAIGQSRQTGFENTSQDRRADAQRCATATPRPWRATS